MANFKMEGYKVKEVLFLWNFGLEEYCGVGSQLYMHERVVDGGGRD